MTSLSEMSTGQVLDWIKSIGLGTYASVFLEMEVDGDMLVNDLDNETLMSEDFGLKKVHAKKLLRRVSEFKTKNVEQKSVGEADNNNSNSNSSTNMIHTAIQISQVYDGNSNSNNTTKTGGYNSQPGEPGRLGPTLTGCASLLSEPRISCIGDVVCKSAENWDAINESLESLRSMVGNEEISSMKDIHRDYWQLLLKTSQVIRILTKRGQIRTRFVRTLLLLLNQQSTGKTLTDDDKLRFHSCLTKILSGWADAELTELVTGWKNIGVRLGKKHEHWKTFEKKAVAMAMWKKVALGIGGLILIGGVITLAIATAGLAAPAEVALASWIVPTLIGGAIATAVGVGVLACMNFNKNLSNVFANEKTVLEMQKKLQEMVRGCKLIQDSLTDSQTIIKLMDEELKEMTPNSLGGMEESLRAILKNLEEFTRQGEKVTVVVRRARDDYLQK